MVFILLYVLGFGLLIFGGVIDIKQDRVYKTKKIYKKNKKEIDLEKLPFDLELPEKWY